MDKFEGKILNSEKKLKPKFWRFQGQFDLEDQVNFTSFRTFPRSLFDQYMVQVYR